MSTVARSGPEPDINPPFAAEVDPLTKAAHHFLVHGHGPFDFTRPAILYLLRHAEWPTYKIGVTNEDTGRLEAHEGAGWELVESRTANGEIAYEVEQTVLAWWRNELQLGPYLSREQMPQGGWTETVSSEAVDLAEVTTFIDAAIAVARGPTNTQPARSREGS